MTTMGAELFAIWIGLSGALLALSWSWRRQRPLAVRARAHMRLAIAARATLAPSPTARKRLAAALQELLDRAPFTRSWVRAAADLMAQAGWRSAEAVPLYFGARLIGPPLFAALAILAAPLLVAVADPATRLMVAGAGAFAGLFAPGLAMGNVIQKRRARLQLGLPDAIDLLVICAEAGLSLDAAIARVGREIRANAPELGDELALTAIELGFLPQRLDALVNLARRAGLPPVRSLVAMLSQTERFGTPLAHSLRILAAEFRTARMMRAEEKAARLPAILTVPMIVFIMPPLFIVLLGPAIIQIFAATG